MQTGRILKLLAQVCIGIAILLWILQLSDISQIWEIMVTVEPLAIILTTVAFVSASTMAAFAFYIPLKRKNPDTSMKNTILASFGGQLLSDVTPARSGYLITPALLNKLDATPIEAGMAGIAATGVANFLVKASISMIALLYFLSFLPMERLIVNVALVSIAILLSGGIGLLIVMWGWSTSKIAKIIEKLPLTPAITNKIVKVFKSFREETAEIGKSIIGVVLLIFLGLTANATAFYTLSNFLWYNPPSFLDFLFMAALAGTISFLPVTIAGLGVEEGSYILILTLLGMPFERAIVLTLLARVLFTGTDAIGLPALLKLRSRL